MKKISTSQAPAAIGPYSQAVCLGRAVFTSGQIPVVPETGVVPEGIEAQAHQSCKNVAAILAATGNQHGKGRQNNLLSGRHGRFCCVQCRLRDLLHPEARTRLRGGTLSPQGCAV